MAFVNLKSISLVAISSLAPLISALGQKQVISFESAQDSFQLAGGDVGTGQILVSSDDYWGVIRAAGDLALDFGRVTGTTYTLSNGVNGSEPASYTFSPVDVSNNTIVSYSIHTPQLELLGLRDLPPMGLGEQFLDVQKKDSMLTVAVPRPRRAILQGP